MLQQEKPGAGRSSDPPAFFVQCLALQRLAAITVFADEGLHGLEVVWQHGATLRTFEQVGKVSRKLQRLANTRLFHCLGEFHRVSGAQRYHGCRQAAAALTGGINADGRMRIQQFAGGLEHVGDSLAGLLVVNCLRVE